MKKAFSIAWKDLRIEARDLSSFLLLLVMPLILIFVLGTAFSGMFGSSSAPFTVKVAFVDQDHGDLARLFRDDVLQGQDLKEILLLKPYANPEEAREAVRQGMVSAAVIVPEGFTQAVNSDGNATIEVLANQDQTIKAGVVKNIAEAFITEILGRRQAMRMTVQELLDRGLIDSGEIAQIVAGWLPQIESQEQQIQWVSEQTDPTKRLPNAMGYYAISMGVMYILFAANTAGSSILRERRMGTLTRLFSAPIERTTVLAGKLLGIFLLALVQFLLIVAVTALVYGVSWGRSLGGVTLMVLATVLCLAGLGAMLASLYRTEGQAAAIGPSVALLLTFLAGGMMVFSGGPDWLNVVSHLSPVRWAMDGFLSLMAGDGISRILLPFGVLTGMGLVFFFVSFLRIRRTYDVG